MPGTKDGVPNLGSAQFSVFDCPPDTLDAISQACGPWLAASSIRGSPLEAPPGPGRQAAGRALSWVVAACLFQAILPAFASGWDPRSEPSNVKEQMMFAASGTSCQNVFICPERGITLPSAKYDHLYVRTLPGRTKRYILASARVGRGPLSGPGFCLCGPVQRLPHVRQQGHSQTWRWAKPATGHCDPGNSGGTNPVSSPTSLDDLSPPGHQQAQVTPCPTTKHTAHGADPWAITRAHTLVKAADLPAGHVRSFQGDTKAPRRTPPSNVPGLDCQILTSDAIGIMCDEGSAGLSRSRKGPRSAGHVPGPPMPRPYQGTCSPHGPVSVHTSQALPSGAAVCVEVGIRPQTDRQTTNGQTVLSLAQGPGRACD